MLLRGDNPRKKRAIKQSVNAVYLSLKTQDRIYPEDVGLSPTNLAIAASSPASSDEERIQAIAVILEFPSANRQRFA